MHDDAPRDYHALSRAERDILTAVGDTDADVSGAGVSRHVADLRNGERPSHDTTYRVLPALVAWGLVHKADTKGKGHAYQLTEDGYQMLRDAADLLAP